MDAVRFNLLPLHPHMWGGVGTPGLGLDDYYSFSYILKGITLLGYYLYDLNVL